MLPFYITVIDCLITYIFLVNPEFLTRATENYQYHLADEGLMCLNSCDLGSALLILASKESFSSYVIFLESSTSRTLLSLLLARNSLILLILCVEALLFKVNILHEMPQVLSDVFSVFLEEHF